MALGEAFITVRADTALFDAELAKIQAQLAGLKVPPINIPTPTGGGGTSGGGGSSQSSANAAALKDYIQKTNDLAVAERAAYAEQNTRSKAAADADKAALAARKALSDAFDDNSSHASAFGNAITSVSNRLSQLGLTGQTRLIAVGLTLGAPIALLGAFTAASAAAAAAITVFGVKAADALRSATLGFQSAGLSASAAKDQVAQLQALADKGLVFANLDADTNALLQIGVAAKDTTPILQTLANAFAASGDVGAVLQADVDKATLALQTLSATASITSKNFATSVKNLQLGVNSTQVFKELQSELGKTQGQLDKLLQSGKVTGAQVASAAVNAAAAGSAGALANAQNQSPTQAVAALKSSLQGALGNAFLSAGPAIAGAINGISTQLQDVVAKFAPVIVKNLPKIIASISSAITPLGDALVSAFQLVVPILDHIGPIVASLARDISGFFSQANTQGSATQKFLQGLLDILEGIAGAFLFLKPIAQVVLSFLGTAVADLGPGFRLIGGALQDIGKFLQPLADLLVKTFNSQLGKVLVGIAAAFVAIQVPIEVIIGAFALLTSPITIVLALAAALVYAYEKSQDFRNFVTQALKDIVDVAAFAITALIRLIQGYVVVPLEAFEEIAKGLSHLPTWLGGGIAGDAAGAIQDLINGINRYADDAVNAIGTAKDAADNYIDTLNTPVTPNININPALNALGSLDSAALQSQALIAAALDSANAGAFNETTGLSGRQADATATERAAAAAAATTPKATPKVVFPPAATGGSSGAADAAKTAASKLADATKTLDKALADFGTTAAGLKSATDVTSFFQTVQDDINSFDTAIGKKEPTGLKTYITKQKAALQSLVAQIATIEPEITAGLDATAQSISSTRAFGSLSDIFGSIATTASAATVDLSKLIIVTGQALAPPAAAVSASQSFQQALDARVTAAQAFAANIQKLRGLGLDAGALSDLINGGVSGSGATAAQLAGETKAQIDAINKSEVALTAAGTAIGATAGDAAAAASQNVGEQVVNGLVAGLQAKDSALIAAAKNIGTTISDEIKKELKIKSPSLVMHGHGVNAVQGLINGMQAMHPGVVGVASRLATAAQPVIGRSGLGGVTGNGVTHNSSLELRAPITVNNYGSADTGGEAVYKNLHRVLSR